MPMMLDDNTMVLPNGEGRWILMDYESRTVIREIVSPATVAAASEEIQITSLNTIGGQQSQQQRYMDLAAEGRGDENATEVALDLATRGLPDIAHLDKFGYDSYLRDFEWYKQLEEEEEDMTAIHAVIDAAIKMEVEDGTETTDMAWYRNYLEGAYGVTINDDVPLTPLALQNYDDAIERFSDFLAEAIGLPDDMPLEQKGALFQLVMGDININRTLIRPDGSYKDEEPVGNALTRGHTIDDIFDSGRKPYNEYKDADGNLLLSKPHPMTENNFFHELVHSFVNSSGMGNVNNSPLAASAGGYYTTMQGTNTVHENLASANDPNATGEILADYLLNVQLGLVDPVDKAVMGAAIRQAVQFHTSPEEYAEVFGTTSFPLERATGTEVSFRMNSPSVQGTFDGEEILLPKPNEGPNEPVASFDSTRVDDDGKPDPEYGTVDIVGITTRPYKDDDPHRDDEWVYVGISDGNQGTQYYWVRADVIEQLDNQEDTLPPNVIQRLRSEHIEKLIDWDNVALLDDESMGTPFDYLDPFRPFSADDEYNPPELKKFFYDESE